MNKKLLLITAVIFTALNSFGQNDSIKIVHGDTIFLKVDKPAEYKGGAKELATFLQSRFGSNIPVNTNGRGYYPFKMQFIVLKDGNISDIDVSGNLGEEMNQELIRAIKKARKFKPALVNKSPVNSYYYQMVTFVAQ